jgi:hypothetical protein
MHRVFSILPVVALLAIPPNLSAKRAAPQPVDPVVTGNIRYSAQGDGRTGYVVANEVATGKELWKVEIFHIHVKPWREEDNQWIFINNLKLLEGALLVRDERSRCYRVGLATRHVTNATCP